MHSAWLDASDARLKLSAKHRKKVQKIKDAIHLFNSLSLCHYASLLSKHIAGNGPISDIVLSLSLSVRVCMCVC